jgi:hypothetical protein
MIGDDSTSWDKPVGKTEPISVDRSHDPILGEIVWVTPQPPYLDTLIFRDDLSKYQVRMAERAIENLKGMMRTGWIREDTRP